MADEKVSVLIDVKVESDAALKRQQELKGALEATKASLIEIGKTQGKTSEEYIKAEAQIATLNQQLRNNGTVLKQIASDSSNVSGAYAALNQKAAEAKQVAKDMAVAYGASNEKTIAATATANQYTKQLKETDKSLGEGNREVGLYSEALDGFKGKLDMFPTSFAQMKQGLGSVAQGFMGVIKQMWLMVANPIGAIIAAVALALFGLYSVFKDFKPIVDLVEQSLAALGAIFEVVKNVVIGLFTGQKSLTESTKGLGDAMGAAAKQAMELKKAQQELEDGQASLEVQNKRAETQMQKLLLQSKNRTLSEKERIKLIDDAMKIETDIFNRKKAQNDEEVRIAENKIVVGKDLTANEIKRLRSEGVAYARELQNKKDITDEEITALKEALLKREDINQSSVQLQEKAMNRRDALADAEVAKEEKRQEKIKVANEKAAAEKEKLEAKAIALAEKKKAIAEKAAADELTRLKKQADDAIAVLDYEAQMALLKAEELRAGKELSDQEAHTQKLADLTKENTDYLAAQKVLLDNKQITQAQYDQNTKLANQQLKTDIAISDAEFNANQAQIKQDNLLNQWATEKEIAQLKGEDMMAYEKAQLEKQMAEELAATNLTEEQKLLIKEKYKLLDADLEKKKADNNLSLASQFAGNIATIFGKNTKVGKAAASAQIAIDTYKGAFAAYSALASIPFVGIPLGITAAAAVAMQGARAIKDVWAVKSGLPGDGGGGGASVAGAVPTASAPAAAAITGGLVSRQSGQVQQQAQTMAVDTALKANPTQPVLVVQDVTTALNQQVQLKSDNSL